MVDNSTREVARMASELSLDTVPESAMTDARRLAVDTLGCMVGGWDGPPAVIARKLARAESGRPAARVLGENFTSSVEAAAVANIVASRFLDFNDTYQGVGIGHPSDMICGLLSVAESEGRSGADFLLSVVTAYEAFAVPAKEISIRDKGWDQGVLIGLGAAAGAAKLMGLDETQTAEAIGLVVTMCEPTRASRSGRLHMWKAAATAAAVKLGIFAARLARAGMTGPDEPIEGRHGMWEQVTGPFTVHPFGEPWIVSNTSIKFLPFESNAHGPVELAFQLREKVDVDRLKSIRLGTYWSSYHDIGSEPEKWAPDTRETADHSLPYIIAAALLDGNVDKHSFDDDRIADPRIRELMAKMTVEHEQAFTDAYPAEVHSSLTATMVDGEQEVFEVTHPLGHPRNHGTWDDIEAKFMQNAREGLDEARGRQIFASLRELQTMSAAEVVDLFVTEDVEE